MRVNIFARDGDVRIAVEPLVLRGPVIYLCINLGLYSCPIRVIAQTCKISKPCPYFKDGEIKFYIVSMNRVLVLLNHNN